MRAKWAPMFATDRYQKARLPRCRHANMRPLERATFTQGLDDRRADFYHLKCVCTFPGARMLP
jgi:hypothetical protein